MLSPLGAQGVYGFSNNGNTYVDILIVLVNLRLPYRSTRFKVASCISSAGHIVAPLLRQEHVERDRDGENREDS